MCHCRWDSSTQSHIKTHQQQWEKERERAAQCIFIVSAAITHQQWQQLYNAHYEMATVRNLKQKRFKTRASLIRNTEKKRRNPYSVCLCERRESLVGVAAASPLLLRDTDQSVRLNDSRTDLFLQFVTKRKSRRWSA